MASIFITGAADGLGKMAARLLVSQGHSVTVHARSPQRTRDALTAVPGAAGAIAGDLSSIAETKDVAARANSLPPFDAIIHNAGIGSGERKRIVTADGLPAVFAVNSLAPYILTCLMKRPKRLIYITSGLHRGGNPNLEDLGWEHKPWNGFGAYSDSKLYLMMLAFAVARKWKDVYSNTVEPGWVATKMGGPGAPDSLEEGPVTQAWLAVSEDKAALTTGSHYFHKKVRGHNPAADNADLQDQFLAECGRLSGVGFPA